MRAGVVATTLGVMAKLALLGGTPVRRRPFPAWPVWGPEERRGLDAVLRSGQWWRGGGWDSPSRVRDFETAFARLQGVRHAVAVPTGTLALELALRAAGVGHGDEVLVPTYTFIATATAPLAVGARPVFCDVDPATLNLDVEDAARKVTRRTRVVMPVHLAGNPADMDAINRLARKKKLLVIEDAAQAHGARWGGRGVGAIGAMGGFSFQASKNLNAGEGGLVTTDSPVLAEKLFSLHHVGRKRGSQFYLHYRAGGNLRMTEWQAAILLAQLKRFPAQEARRNANVARLIRRLATLPGFTPQAALPKAQRSYHLAIFRHDPALWGGVSRDLLLKALQAEGVPCHGGYAVPVHRNPLFAEDRSYRGASAPEAERICREAVWFRHAHFLGFPSDVDDIADALEKIYAQRGELAVKSSRR